MWRSKISTSRRFLCIRNLWVKHGHQISTPNLQKEKGPITRNKLAEYIAKRIKDYLEELKVSQL